VIPGVSCHRERNDWLADNWKAVIIRVEQLTRLQRETRRARAESATVWER
jgi:hypothetical protein